MGAKRGGLDAALQKVLIRYFGKRDPDLVDVDVRDVERWEIHLLKNRSRNTLSIYHSALHAAWNRAAGGLSKRPRGGGP